MTARFYILDMHSGGGLDSCYAWRLVIPEDMGILVPLCGFRERGEARGDALTKLTALGFGEIEEVEAP